jgi:hypothetical protein
MNKIKEKRHFMNFKLKERVKFKNKIRNQVIINNKNKTNNRIKI